MNTQPAMSIDELNAAIARRDPEVSYERGEFDLSGVPVVCTYRASNPFVAIACRAASNATGAAA